MSDLLELRRRVDQLTAEYEHARRSVREERDRLGAASARLEAAVSAQKVVQEVAAGLQEQAHAQIAKVVSKCLAAVFDDPYEFRVLFEQKRGKTEARLVYTRGDREFDPTTEAGGGVVDVTAFALRVASVLLQRPALRRVLCLDEPFRMLSRDYAPRVRELLVTLAEELAFQFLVVTHSPALVAGRVVELP